MALSTNIGGASSDGNGMEMLPLNRQLSQASALCLTPKLGKRSASKKLQFSTPEYSVTPISVIPGISNRIMMLPGRKREEAMVMANLRKRVAAVDLTRKKANATNDDPNANDTGQGQEQLDNRPLLPKVSSKRDMSAGDESPRATMLQDKDFILDCLCWHNEYRARHAAPALTVSPELCEYAQQWANHLASTNEFYYRSDKNLGQNLFCCPISALVTDLTGQEVASYWYSTVRRYNYFKESSLLHTNVNAGHFTQLVWVNSRYFGVGKQTSRTGKIFVVAYYFPAGNNVGAFHLNVLPPVMDQDNLPPSALLTSSSSSSAGATTAAAQQPPPPIDFDNNPISSILKSGSSGSNSTN